jgi:4'-phosphopantetheinyl transferase
VPINDWDLFEHLLSRVTPEKVERIFGYRREDDGLRTLFGDLLLRRVIMMETGMPNEDIEFGYTDFGKPYLKGRSDFHFNLSHSGDWAVAAADTAPVGVDVERITDVDYDVSEHFFTGEERRNLINSSDKAAYFFTLWSLKESYVKLIGKGVSQPLNSISIRPAAGTAGDEFIMEVEGKAMDNVFFALYDIHRDYKTALCAVHHPLPGEAVLLPPQQLIRDFF